MPNSSEEWRHEGTGDTDAHLDLRSYWAVLVERRRVIASLLIATVVFGLVITFLQTPKYVAATTLQIERQAPDFLTFKDVVSIDPSYAAYQDFYQTQYKILNSRSVLRRAAERLDLLNRPEYLNRKGSPVGRLYGWATGILRSGNSEDEDEEGAPEDSPDPWDQAAGFISAGVSIEPVRNSHLVTVSFTDTDPVLTAEVANAVADAYQQFTLEARYTTTEQASEFLAREVARHESDIATLEQQLQDYGSQKEILALSEGTQDVSEQALADLNARLTTARGRLALSEARFETVRDAPPDSLTEVLTSPLIGGLRQEYAELERKYSQMAQKFKPGWPALAQLQEEMDQTLRRLSIESENLARQVREVAGGDYDQALAEVKYLERQVGGQKKEVRRVTQDAVEYGSLKKEIETRRRVLEELVTRQSETEASGQLRDARSGNIRVVDRAEVPESPARPRRLLNLAIALVLGLGLGVTGAFVMHYLDNTVKTEGELARYSGGMAVLAHVPLYRPLRLVRNAEQRHEPSADVGVIEDPQSGFAEAFRNLRTSLLLASPERPPRTIVVTSSEPGEGKSTVALNLAVALTQVGRRVLLIDGDLRRPRLHKMLDLPNDSGLSSFLTGNVAAEDLIEGTDTPELSVITSGPIPPNPSELLDATSLDRLLRFAEADCKFDHVIFDAPPALHVADGIILSARMDATILVARAGVTTREELSDGASRLRQARAKVVGAVLNAVHNRSGYYYHRYRYHGSDVNESPSRPRRGKKFAIVVKGRG